MNNKITKILKLLEHNLYKIDTYTFLSDVFECGAIAISNRFDFRNYEKREKRYKEIINKYDKQMQKLIVEVFTEIYQLLINQNENHVFNDYLGEIYMNSYTQNKKAGQFFTPYHLSKVTASLSINENIIKDIITQNEVLTLSEPACGSGGIIVAAIEILANKYDFNYASNLFVDATDIDTRCVHMTYLQLTMLGVPAMIKHGDALTNEVWDTWFTPSYLMQYPKFLKYVIKKQKAELVFEDV